jgi:hypothetical protein
VPKRVIDIQRARSKIARSIGIDSQLTSGTYKANCSPGCSSSGQATKHGIIRVGRTTPASPRKRSAGAYRDSHQGVDRNVAVNAVE